MILLDEIYAFGGDGSTHGVSNEHDGLSWELGCDVLNDPQSFVDKVGDCEFILILTVVASVSSEIERYTHRVVLWSFENLGQ